MDTQSVFDILPVVIVGKDRTRMTCAVIDHIKAHVKNATPYFICVSDRSREGHSKVIAHHLKDIGERQFMVLQTDPSSNRYGWGAAINIGLECAFDICKGSPCALVVDNDWLLQKDLDIEKYMYTFMFSRIGAITFKPVHKGTNVSLEEHLLSDGSVYLLRSRGKDEKFSFTAEIGCMLITKNMIEHHGAFKENCRTDETEWEFCNWYNGLSEEIKTEKCIWYATDKDFYHEGLNDEGHVFTHVGLISQHEGPHKWTVPDEYKYLSIESEDEKICKTAMNESIVQKIPEEIKPHPRITESVYINWARYFDKVYCISYLSESNPKIPRLKRELERVDLLRSPVFEMRYDVRIDGDSKISEQYASLSPIEAYRYEALAFLKILKEAKYLGYSRICILEDDVAFLKNKSEIANILDNLPDAPAIQMDKAIWTEEDKEALQHPKREENGYIYSAYNFLASACTILSKDGIESVIEQIEKNHLPIDRLGKTFGDRLAVAKKNLCIQMFYDTCEGAKRTDPQGNHCAYMNQRIDPDYSEYSVPDGYNANTFYHEIETDSDDVVIPWHKYFDKVFCLFWTARIKERMPRLRKELQRVGLLDSPVFEWVWDANSTLEDPIREDPKWDNVGNIYKVYAVHYVNMMKNALALGYKRIMVIEDDIAFLKDKRRIIDMLVAMPETPFVQMDKFIWTTEKTAEFNDAKKRGDKYVVSKYGFSAATCNIYNQKGMEEYIKVLEARKCANDNFGFFVPQDVAIAVDPLAVQVIYPKSLYSDNLKSTTRTKSVEHWHMLYRAQGIDENYSQYAVPEGYNMKTPYDPNASNPIPEKKPTKKGRKFISVYAIAKNEASVAARWYECVKEADEVCVLDTGSTDDTVKILRDLGAHVEIKTYDDWSFAVARNDSMKLVSPESEILFTLDLDETISPGWRKKLEDAWLAEESKGRHPGGVKYKYIWSFDSNGKEMQSFAVRKIHTNGNGHWKYRCHELLIDVGGDLFFLDDFVVEHHQNKQTSRSKYIGLLEKDAREMPEDDRSAYYYARELMYAERWEEAIVEFKRHLSLKSAGWRCERASSMRNIANCYGHLNHDEARELWLWKAADEDPDNREATYWLADMAMNRKDYRTAVKEFERCLAIKTPSLDYISAPIVWTARPWFLYAQALWWTGRWSAAIDACAKGLEIEPNNKSLKQQYSDMQYTRDKYRKQGNNG